jgi:hypothetical protein
MRAVNLIPPEQRSDRPVGAGRSQGAAYAVLGLFAGLAVMTLLYAQADHQLSSRRAQVASLTEQTQNVESQAGRLAPYTSFLALREKRVQAVDALLDARFGWAHALHELGRVLPNGTSITSLEGGIGAAEPAKAPSSSGVASTAASGSGAVASATPPGSVPTFKLSGCAENQALVAETLGRLRLIDGVDEVQLTSSTAGSTGSGGGGAGCPSHDPSFTVQVLFDPLPSATAVAAATKAAPDPTSARSDASATTAGASLP